MNRAGRARFDVALAATLHDPAGALTADVRRALPALRMLYRDVAVTTSPATAAAVVAALAAGGAHAGTPPTDTRGPLYRLAIRRALASGAARVHYLDFDRALHAAARRPRALAAVLRVAERRRALLVGRTLRAHRSHQRPLFATETVANRRLAARLGLDGRVDFLAPSFVLDRAAARRVLARSRTRGETIYGELAALVAAAAPVLAYVESDALDWETPDRHRRAVRRLGLARWRRRFDAASEWRLRTDLAEAIVRGFDRTLARHPSGRVQLSRLRLPEGAARGAAGRASAGPRGGSG